MKDLCQYGNRPEDEWEILPWIPDPRPPFKIWVKPEQIAPFFLIPHHPYAISLLLKISDGFRTEEFCRLGLTGSSGDWEQMCIRDRDISRRLLSCFFGGQGKGRTPESHRPAEMCIRDSGCPSRSKAGSGLRGISGGGKSSGAGFKRAGGNHPKGNSR